MTSYKITSNKCTNLTNMHKNSKKNENDKTQNKIVQLKKIKP